MTDGDAELRQYVRRIRSALTAHRRIFLSIDPRDRQRYMIYNETRDTMAEMAEYLDESLKMYNRLRDVAHHQGIRLALWDGDEWEWTGTTWRRRDDH